MWHEWKGCRCHQVVGNDGGHPNSSEFSYLYRAIYRHVTMPVWLKRATDSLVP